MLRTLTLFSSAAVALLVVSASAPRAEACSCLAPDVPSAYGWATDVVKVRIWGGLKGAQKTYYRARVLDTYKGCQEHDSWLWLVTSSSSAACGVTLQLGGVYLINGNSVGPHRLSIGLCGMNVPFKSLSSDDKAWLAGREVCCEGECACADGSEPVECFVDPCEVNACPEGTCEANYCGGCNAEFYDGSGYETCNDCDDDGDCSWGQICTADGCLSEAGAASALHWFSTCGAPVCGPDEPPPGDLPKCAPGVDAADACSDAGAQCDDGLGCGAALVCAQDDPKASGCPISRADKKTDIHYLDPTEQEHMSRELLDFRLATYRYKAQGPSAPLRLGFMIDDVEPSVAVDAKRDMVDLYGYLSMTVATLQVQAQKIDALEAQVRALQSELGKR